MLSYVSYEFTLPACLPAFPSILSQVSLHRTLLFFIITLIIWTSLHACIRISFFFLYLYTPVVSGLVYRVLCNGWGEHLCKLFIDTSRGCWVTARARRRVGCLLVVDHVVGWSHCCIVGWVSKGKEEQLMQDKTWKFNELDPANISQQVQIRHQI